MIITKIPFCIMWMCPLEYPLLEMAKMLQELCVLSRLKGGKLARVADVETCLPATETYMIQGLHLPMYHYLCLTLEKLFGK